MERVEYGNCLLTLHPVLTPEECAAFIARAEGDGFEIATINGSAGVRVDRLVRNNDRVIIDDPALAADLWERVREQIPAVYSRMHARGLNERFRFYRYQPGQRFAWHVDGAYERSNGERSLLTFMIYLNEGYAGGETRFSALSISGSAGMALVFDHQFRHEGAELVEGVKYVLRSDVMFAHVSTEQEAAA